ncbi:MAG: hypothetical protein DRI46_09130 [Chloroflexi bacterium]|nr:MAG: hypothetical protein DRI46_09130 [Chloroflexota bacterium]
MSLARIDPVLGGIPIHFPSGITISQTYQDIGGFTSHRMMNGAGIKQTHWTKIGTSISGQGFLPNGIDALDFGQPLVLKCGAALAIQSVSNVMTLPVNRRSDVAVTARAILDTDFQSRTPVNVVGDIATVDVVAGAQGYLVFYYPQITVFATPVQENIDLNNSTWDWSIECEEI